MKVVNDTPKKDRHELRREWAVEFLCLCPGSPLEVPTSYRDGGANIRFRWRNGFTAEWKWRECSPADAAKECEAAPQLAAEIVGSIFVSMDGSTILPGQETLLNKLSRLVSDGLEPTDSCNLPRDTLEEMAMRLQLAGYGVVNIASGGWTYSHGATPTRVGQEDVRRRLEYLESQASDAPEPTV